MAAISLQSTCDGKPMPRLTTNIRKLYAFSALQMTLFPMAIITLFWKDRIGLSLAQILLLQGVLSVVMVVMEYPSGYVSDRIGYRAALTVATVTGTIGWGIYTVAATFGHVLCAEMLLGVSLSFISGSDSALLYETLKAEGRVQEYASHQGRMSGFGQAGEALGAIFAGTIYAAAPTLPFVLQVAVWLLALLLTRTLVEPERPQHRPVSHLADAWRSARYAFVENPRLRATILLNSVLGIASFYPVWLIQPYMQRAGVPLNWFGPVWTGANLTVALSAMASHRLRNWLGERAMLLLFLLLVALGYGGLGMSGGIWGFLCYYALTCMRGLRGPMLLDHAQRESPSTHRAGLLSLQSLAFRLLFVCTGPLIGRLADAAGVQRTFQLLGYCFLAVLPPLVWLFLRQERERKHLSRKGEAER